MSLPSSVCGETIEDSGSILIANHPPSYSGHSKATETDIFMTSELGYDPRDITVTEFMDRVCVELEIERSVTLTANENALEGLVAAHMTQNVESLTPQQEAWAYLQDIQDTPMSFPTLDVFAPQLPDLVPYPSIDPQYDSVQPSTVVQAPHDGYGGGYYHNGFDNAGPHLQMGFPILPATEYTAHPYPDSTMDTMIVLDTPPSYASESDGSSSSTPDGTARPRRSQRLKRKARQDFEAADVVGGRAELELPSKRRRIDDEEIGEGAFGAYTSADASATIMPVPHFNPKPVDISGRRTHDDNGEVLRTRNYGVMELDDSYSDWSVDMTQELPAGMTCVRSCDWTDQPCGLYVEVNDSRIAHHNLHWHGVELKGTALCKFGDCSDRKPKKIASHIDSVHYNTSYECPYCKGLWSRHDAVTRHYEKCKSKLALAKQQGRKFLVHKPKKIVHGYIVPAQDAS